MKVREVVTVRVQDRRHSEETGQLQQQGVLEKRVSVHRNRTAAKIKPSRRHESTHPQQNSKHLEKFRDSNRSRSDTLSATVMSTNVTSNRRENSDFINAWYVTLGPNRAAADSLTTGSLFAWVTFQKIAERP